MENNFKFKDGELVRITGCFDEDNTYKPFKSPVMKVLYTTKRFSAVVNDTVVNDDVVTCRCVWFDSNNHLQHEDIPENILDFA